MNYLYLLINIATISIPLIASYHPKIQFYKNHRAFLLAIAISGKAFIIWDFIFADMGVWGFSDSYTLGFGLFGLPIEEWLFFLCIPYASLFLHLQLDRFGWLRPFRISDKLLNTLSSFIVLVVCIIGLLNIDRWYTSINALVFISCYFFALYYYRGILKKFIPSFLIILIPFFLVNGLLTGSLIDEPIVWYNSTENLGIRIGTVPIEDVFYAFSMLILPLVLYSKITTTTKRSLKTAH